MSDIVILMTSHRPQLAWDQMRHPPPPDWELGCDVFCCQNIFTFHLVEQAVSLSNPFKRNLKRHSLGRLNRKLWLQFDLSKVKTQASMKPTYTWIVTENSRTNSIHISWYILTYWWCKWFLLNNIHMHTSPNYFLRQNRRQINITIITVYNAIV